MKAQNLSICIPNRGCNKNCPYCISRMTGYMDANEMLAKRNLGTVKHFAGQLNVSSVLLTGKGETLLNDKTVNDVLFYLEEFKCYVTELQTNGLTLFDSNDNVNLLDSLYKANLNIIAFSIDNPEDITDNRELFKILNEEYGFVTSFPVGGINLVCTGSARKGC
jgi:sulfatase maturation enzyme AslB (radical SAM superfamily)